MQNNEKTFVAVKVELGYADSTLLQEWFGNREGEDDHLLNESIEVIIQRVIDSKLKDLKKIKILSQQGFKK